MQVSVAFASDSFLTALVAAVLFRGVLFESEELGEGVAKTSESEHRDRSGRQQGGPGEQESGRVRGRKEQEKTGA